MAMALRWPRKKNVYLFEKSPTVLLNDNKKPWLTRINKRQKLFQFRRFDEIQQGVSRFFPKWYSSCFSFCTHDCAPPDKGKNPVGKVMVPSLPVITVIGAGPLRTATAKLTLCMQERRPLNSRKLRFSLVNCVNIYFCFFISPRIQSRQKVIRYS